tara:strand:+ start:276 stop:443 length:168 start_codon:yes stop_codon:yes gene_type:complete
MNTEDQQKLNKSLGWGAALKEAHKTVVTGYKTKAKNIVKGIKATPSILKRTFKNK